MTSPYSSSLLNEPPTARAPRPLAAPRPAPVYVQQPQHIAPQVVYAQPQRSSNAALGLVVVLLVLLAAGAGYFISRSGAPTPDEALRYQQVAAQDGFFNGQRAGLGIGHDAAVAEGRDLARLKGLIASEQARNAGYAAGKRAGLASYRRPHRSWSPRYYGGGGYYRRPVSRGWGNSSVRSAMSEAQGLANATGAPVDVEVFN